MAMKTVKICIGPPDPNQQIYPVTLSDFSDGSILQTAKLPVDTVLNAPLNPKAILDKFQSQYGIASDFEAIGKQLATWLCYGPIGSTWRNLRQQPLRTFIEVEPEELAVLPWELLISGASFDFLSRQKPCLRFHQGQDDGRATGWPLRVLVVVGAETNSNIKADDEAIALERELLPFCHSIDLEVIYRPTQQKLSAKLCTFQPHIFHFIGHCNMVSGKSVLRFQLQDSNQSWDWGADMIAVTLDQTAWRPRLAFLNACHTWTPAEAQASLQIASAFLEADVPACLAMQGDIHGDLAANFASKILGEISKGTLLDEAVVKARFAIKSAPNTNPKDWALPVLSLSQLPEIVVPAKHRHSNEWDQKIENCPLFQETRLFAGRREERRRLRSSVEPMGQGRNNQHLLVVTGSSELGKSYLVKWCLEGFALQNYYVQYVEIADGKKKDFVEVLRLIRDSNATDGLNPLLDSVFYKFNWVLNHILNTGVVPPWSGEPVADHKLPFDPQNLRHENPLPLIADAFLDALREASKQQPLIIVLDTFNRDTELALARDLVEGWLWPLVLRPIREAQIPGVTIVLVMLTDILKEYRIERWVPRSEWIVIDPFKKANCNQLASELLWYANCEENCEEKSDAQIINYLIKAWAETLPDPWPAVRFKKLLEGLEIFCNNKAHLKKVGRML